MSAYRISQAIFSIFLLCIPLLGVSQQSDLSVTDRELVERKRVSRTEYRFDYRAVVSNNGVAKENVILTVTSNSDDVVIDSGEVIVGTIAAGATVTTADLFSIIIDRRIPFDPNALVYSFSFDVVDNDSDDDGVDNELDQCPNTPPGVEVGPDGCPLATDTTPPQITITSPVADTFVTVGRPVIKFSASDNDSGVDNDSVVINVNTVDIDVVCNFAGGNAACVPTNDLPQGDINLQVSISDLSGNSASAQSSFKVDSLPLSLDINSPAEDLITDQTSILVTGTADDALLSVSVNGVLADLSDGNFSATVPLREGKNMLVAVGTNVNGRTATDTVDVTRDNIAPIVRIDTPRNNFTSVNDVISVTGTVNDIVSGGVDPRVTVNGIEATVGGGTFMVLDVPLVRGANVIEAIARDAVGNEGRNSVTVNFTPSAGAKISISSGNGQSDFVNSSLTEPLVVQVTDSLNNPVAARVVTFEVTRNSGSLQASPTSPVKRKIQVATNGSGKAQVFLSLGDTSGEGNNRVIATALGVSGEVEFCATALAKAPDKILMSNGDNQRGITGQPLPTPFEVLVVDADGNPVSGVDVLFSVTSGNGHFNGESSLTKTSGIDGLVRATLTLDSQPGINNNVVSATAAGLMDRSALFVASGLAPGNPDETNFRGVVLDNTQTPISGAVITVDENPDISATTDSEGQFFLEDVPVGKIHLHIDPTNSSRSETFPELEFETVTIAGQDNILGQPIMLPRLQLDGAKLVGGDEDVVVEMPGVPGMSITVFANSATFPDGSKVGEITLSQVHLDKVPMAPPNGSLFMPPAWTIQPHGVIFDPPAKVSIPNDGLPPGRVIDVFQFDHLLNEFIDIGKGTVSDDGFVIETDPGFGVTRSGWGGCGLPQPPNTCTCNCNDNNDCTIDRCSGQPNCNCTHTNKANGTMCDSNGDGTQNGTCQSGVCQPATEFNAQPAMTDPVSIPWTKNNIEASPGEQMIFNLRFEDKDRRRPKGTTTWTEFTGAGPYELKMNISGDAEFDSSGSGSKMKTFTSLRTGNVNMFIDSAWTGTTITVTATLEDKATPPPAPDFGSTKDANKTITWTIIKRTTCPTSMVTVSGAVNVFRPNPAIYGYRMDPDLPPPGRPDYENQTILETFGNVTANGFTMSDVTAAFKTANPTLNTPNKVAVFLWNTSNNGTFVVNAQDRIFDRHGGFGSVSAFTAAARASGIGYIKPQDYRCDSNVIQSYDITRRNVGGVITIKKTGP